MPEVAGIFLPVPSAVVLGSSSRCCQMVLITCPFPLPFHSHSTSFLSPTFPVRLSSPRILPFLSFHFQRSTLEVAGILLFLTLSIPFPLTILFLPLSVAFTPFCSPFVLPLAFLVFHIPRSTPEVAGRVRAGDSVRRGACAVDTRCRGADEWRSRTGALWTWSTETRHFRSRIDRPSDRGPSFHSPSHSNVDMVE